MSFSSQFWFKYFLFKTSCSLRPSISHHVYFSKLNLSTFNIRFCECIIVVNFQFNFYLPFYSFFFLLFPLFLIFIPSSPFPLLVLNIAPNQLIISFYPLLPTNTILLRSSTLSFFLFHSFLFSFLPGFNPYTSYT